RSGWRSRTWRRRRRRCGPRAGAKSGDGWISEHRRRWEMTDMHTPVLPGEGASDYERYLRTDELLSLQKGPDEQVHRDELLFQTVHQASELWLKLAASEVDEAAALVE